MHDDPRFPLFFAYLSLFCFSMLGLVASSNVFMIFIFWELVGICSYLLIGFWYEEKVNCDAANKAFVVNRIGDVGMLVGLGLLWTSLGTFNFQEISQGLRAPGGEFNVVQGAGGQAGRRVSPARRGGRARPARPDSLLAADARRAGDLRRLRGQERPVPAPRLAARRDGRPDAGLGLDPRGDDGGRGGLPGGAVLPGLHAASRCSCIAYTGGITLFIAATIAMVQTDYKKVLAYSTVSQLGFMMLGLGVGGRAAGLFHLLTHAFFKALLFLGAGSVYHSVHTYEMPALGGLLKKMPITAYDHAGGHAGDLGRAVLQRVLLEGRDPGRGDRPGLAEPRALPAVPLAGRRGDDHRLLHVPDVVPDLRRRGPGLPDRESRPHVGARPGRGARHWPTHEVAHGHGARPSRPEPGRPCPRERAGHDLAADHPGGLQRLRRLDLVDRPAVRHAGPREDDRVRRARERDRRALGSLVRPGLLAGDRGGRASAWARSTTLRRTCPTSSRPGSSPPGRPSGSAASTGCSRTSGTSTRSTGPCSSGPAWPSPGFCGQIDKVLIDGLVNGSAYVTERLSHWDGVFDKLGVDGLVNLLGQMVYVAGDRSRAIQTGKLRNYLMFLAVALVGLFAGVFAWISR